MEESESAPPADRRSSDAPLVIASVVCFALAGAAAYHFARPPAEAPIKTTGFDAQEVGQAPAATIASPSATAYSRSGAGSAPPPMATIATGLGSVRIGSQAAGGGSGRAKVGAGEGRVGFDRELVLRETRKLNLIWQDHLKRSAVLRRFTKEWASHPELAALNESWHRDHDPVAFIKGLMKSQSFGQLAFKYGREPDVNSIVMKQIRSADPEAIEQATANLDADKTAKAFVAKLGDAAGIPLGAMLSGQAPDANSLLKNSPGLQQAMQQQK